jgi:hypothetical protein
MNLAAALTHPAQDVIAMENQPKKHPRKHKPKRAFYPCYKPIR